MTQRERTIELMKELCPDFKEYHFLKNDMYKGSLFGGYNMYYKKGINGLEGIVTGPKNIKTYKLDKFSFNFETGSNMSGSKREKGWTGDIMIEVLEYLKSIATIK